MVAGRVIVLNGATSSGKSTLARALQRKLAETGEPWIVVALDDVFARVPPDWFRIGDHIGGHAEDGMVFEMVDGAIERRVGPFGRTLLAAYRAAVAGMARAGLDVIVDEVLLSAEDWEGWRTELDGLDARWVALDVALDVLVRRERDRGDRVIGMTAAQFDVVHAFATYDLRVDTGVLTPEEAADLIMATGGVEHVAAPDVAASDVDVPDLDVMVARVIDRASIPGRHRPPQLAAELADVERVDVATPHGTVAAWRVGEGPAVLLVHGWRDTARLWDPLMAALRARGRAFVALDLPGHGYSEGERCLSAEVPDAVLAVAAALGPVDAAVAHSFATGGTALAVAEGAPVERLVLIAPPLSYRTPGEVGGGAADAGRQRWRRIAAELGFEPAVGDRAIETYLAGLGPSRAAWDLSSGLAGLPTDVLLVASVDDERFDIASARALVDRLPRGTLVELAGLDHRTSARDRVAVDAIVDFVR